MRRFIALLLAAPFAAALPAQQGPQNPDGTPSVTDPSVPLSYVGNDGSVSLGINSEGRTEGQLLGVFARSNERAVVAQLWWDRAGAGGVQSDYNWLWGMTGLEARQHPEDMTVARLTFAMDQNADHDRKATLGFGIERKEFSVEGYLARGISSARAAGSALHAEPTTVTGNDEIGSYSQVETTTLETLFESKPYGMEVGLQLSHVFEPLAMRVHGGASVQDGDGARASTFSVGLDTPLGTRGWGLSALGEHVSRHNNVDPDSNDDRLSVFLRYEFGGHGSFVPTSQLEDPAWISRSLGRPSSAHPRVVESYRARRSQTVSVTRGPRQYSNHFPILHDDSATASSGLAATIDVLANDSDADGDHLVVTAVTSPAHGSATISSAGIVYTPTAGYSGADSFGYTVSDGRGGTASAQVAVSVSAQPNQAPLAHNDTAGAAFNQPTTIDVLANDTDANGDALQVLSVGTPAHGSAVVSGHDVIYTPQAGFSGGDTFTYTIGDGHDGTSTATITITVAPRLNRAPIARADSATVTFGQLATIDVLANDGDPDGDVLTITGVTAPAHGTVVISGSQLLYTPVAGFVGRDTFRYTISDGRGGTATATVTITVTALPNRPPIAVDDAATTTFPQPVTIAVLGNDSDPDADPLAITAMTAPTIGTAVVSGNSVVYTPAVAGATGIDRFTYTISDGRGGSATATVTITISTVLNQPPVAVDDNATTAFGQPTTIAVLNNDSDPDGDALVITAVTPASSGTATLSGNVVVYTPAAGFSGVDRFAYTISDGRGGTASAFVAVVVSAAPNQPPQAANDAAITPANTPVTVNVLANDSDPDGDPLVIVGLTQPANGSVSASPNGVTYTPNAGYLGFDTFTYTISDGRGGSATAAVAIFVNG